MNDFRTSGVSMAVPHIQTTGGTTGVESSKRASTSNCTNTASTSDNKRRSWAKVAGVVAAHSGRTRSPPHCMRSCGGVHSCARDHAWVYKLDAAAARSGASSDNPVEGSRPCRLNSAWARRSAMTSVRRGFTGGSGAARSVSGRGALPTNRCRRRPWLRRPPRRPWLRGAVGDPSGQQRDCIPCGERTENAGFVASRGPRTGFPLGKDGGTRLGGIAHSARSKLTFRLHRRRRCWGDCHFDFRPPNAWTAHLWVCSSLASRCFSTLVCRTCTPPRYHLRLHHPKSGIRA